MAVWLPFLWLSFYNLPIGMHEWDWMTMNGGQLNGTWWETQQWIYREIMGRYTSNAVLSLTTEWCTLQTFPYFFIFWQLLWVGTLWGVISVMFRDISWLTRLLIVMGIHTLYLFNLEDVYDSLYRYTGVITYQMGFIFGLMSFICFERSRNWLHNQLANYIAGLFFMALCIGTNEISMILVALAVGVLFVYSLLLARKLITRDILALGIAILCCIVVLWAPGNDVRVDAEEGGMGVLHLISLSLGATFYLWFDWLSSSLLLPATLLAFPILLVLKKENSNGSIFSDYRPWFWIMILSVPMTIGGLLFATGGDTFPERVIDHLYIHVLFLWLGLFISLALKWDLATQIRKASDNIGVRIGYFGCLTFVVLHLFGSGISVNRKEKENSFQYTQLIQSGSTITNAWLTLLQGEPQAYHRHTIDQFNKLAHCVSDTCYMEKSKVIPSQLYDPLSDRRNRNGDRFMGYYFNQNIKRVLYQPE